MTPDRFRAALIVLLIAAFAAPLAAQDKMQKFRSRFYQIATDVELQRARKIGRHMDAVFAEYTRRFSQFRSHQRGRQPLYLFKKENGYLQFLANHGIDGTGSGGMFFVRPNVSGLATFLEGQSMARMYYTLRHEGFHQFAYDRIGANLPIWANEGMAEYFGEAVMVRDDLRAGLVPPTRLERLRGYLEQDRLIPMREMMNMTSQQWQARVRAGRGTVQYDQAWSIVHFLVHGDKRYKRAFVRYLKMIAAGRSSQHAFTRAFDTERYDGFARAWRDYVQQLGPDPVKTAARRLQFLAGGMKLLHERGESAGSLDQLKSRLQAIRFRLTRPLGQGKSLELSAEDERNFTAPDPANGRGRSTLKMVDSSKDGLPPGLLVRGLELTLRLQWQRDPEGDLVSRITYR